jgi:hypothetical protein
MQDEDRKRDLGQERLFEKALEGVRLSGDPSAAAVYLGDPQAVESILRSFLADALEVLSAEGDQIAVEAESFDKTMDRVARVFLGEDPKYHMPIVGWHKPGVIDGVLVKLGLANEESSAPDRMKEFFYALFEMLARVIKMSQVEGVEQNQWEWQIQAEIGTYRDILMGTFEPESVVMQAANSGEVADDEGDDDGADPELVEADERHGGLSRTQRSLLEGFKDYP